jgi:hypothetical protein
VNRGMCNLGNLLAKKEIKIQKRIVHTLRVINLLLISKAFSLKWLRNFYFIVKVKQTVKTNSWRIFSESKAFPDHTPVSQF